jgi:hypothetical protein
MDRGDELMAALAAAAEATGFAVETDRRYPIGEAELPRAIVRSGAEETASVDPQLWFRRWIMRPAVEIYVEADDAAASRAQVSAAVAAILDAVRRGPIPRLIARGTTIEATRTPIEPEGLASLSGAVVEFGFTFDR